MSTATASAPLPKNDFPDWLSPIVVKELRQGLKSRAFVSVATLLQGGMAFMFVIAALSAMSPGGSGVDTLSGFFWFMLWVPLIFVMPGRALQAVVEETKVQTLELVQMTRMQSLRIILGKWCALSVQSFLLVLAILPYFVLRYFFGGVDLVNDLINLLSLLGLSMLFTAAGLAASTLKPGLRIVLVIISVAFVLIGGQALAIMSSFGRAGPLGGMAWPASPWLGLLAGGLLLTAYVSFFLLQGADHLSTQVESYSPQKRVLALISSLIIITAWVLHDQTSIDLRILSLLIPLVLWSIAEALVEVNDPDWVLGRNQPFWNFLFRPGWATGLFFALTILGIVFISIWWGQTSMSSEEFEGLWKSYVIFIGAVLTPALILIRMAWVKQRLLLYWLIHLLFAVAFTGAMLMSTRPGLRPEDALAYLAPFPPSIALGLIQQEMDIDFIRTVFPITASVTVAIMSLFLIFSLKALRRSRAQQNLTF
jgi:hypothetical protein